MKKDRYDWSRKEIMALREHLGVTQAEMAKKLGTRQQTISEWELGVYKPRGMSITLLTVVAERCKFNYAAYNRENKVRKK